MNEIQLKNVSIEDIDFSNKKFDVVVNFEVIEHLFSPKEFLLQVKNILNNNGLLILSCPNGMGFDIKLLKDKSHTIDHEHLNYFNFESLSALVQRNGFQIILKQSTFPLELFLLMGDDYVYNSKIGSKKHQERMKFEQNMKNLDGQELKQKLYSKFAEIGIGRRVIIYAKKL